jgi:predicted amidophosphoribosyltransferase
MPRPDLLLPVPLSAERIRERGYNQAWELARRFRRRTEAPRGAARPCRHRRRRCRDDR